MGAIPDVEKLIAAVEEAVEEGLRYFEGPGATSQSRVDQWSVREVLSHFAYWHEGTAQGMESVAAGGSPLKIETPVDDTNAREISSRDGYDFPQLIQEIRGLQKRLAQAARGLADPDLSVLVSSNGNETSARRRLEVIAGHWRGHIEELRTAAKS